MQNNKKILLSLLATLLVTNAQAQIQAGDFQTNATMNATCAVSANDVDFSFSPVADTTVVRSTLTAKVTCSKNLPFTLGLSEGSSGNVLDRIMSSTTTNDKLHYNFYVGLNSPVVVGHTGTGTGTGVINSTGTGSNQNIIVQGRMSKNQFVAPGQYSDSLSVVLTY